VPVSREEVDQAYRARIKTLSCPHCGAAFTDYAVDWSKAWLQGRRDALRELNRQERDGAIKLQCEACGEQAQTDVFFSALKGIEVS
jgi:uncharacterized C2H2 Zn-finger protein